MNYPERVVNGEIIAGKYIKLACQRFLDWLTRDDIEYRQDKVDRVINFIQKLKHTTGRHSGKPFLLEDWQKWVISNIFGFYYTGTNKRVIRNVYITMSRKNGKSAFASAISLYTLIADGEAGAEIDFVASNFKQAKIAFEMASNFCASIDRKGKHFRRYRDNIQFDYTKSKMQVLSSEASGLDGFNSSCFVCDEVHTYSDDKLYSVLKSSQGMRENPLGICITTSGFNLFGFCKTYENTCKEIVAGLKKDDSTFAAIYQLDEEDDWEEENNWYKSNPNLDITVTKDYLREQINGALNNPTLEYSVKTKNLNMWVSSNKTWIPHNYLVDASQKVKLQDFEQLWCGIDLSAVSDLTAISFMGRDDEQYYFKNYYFLPEETVKISPNSDKYREWARLGYLHITDGNVVDYDYALKIILDTNKESIITSIGYDSWNSTQFTINATAEGLPMIPYSQTLGSFNKPSREFERLIKSRKIILDDNPITRWCFENVSIKEDYNGNMKPVKQNADGKIDGVIAILEALGMLLKETVYDNEII